MTITLQRLAKTGSTMTGSVHWDKYNGYGFKVIEGETRRVAKDGYATKCAAARAMRRWMRSH